MHATPLEIETLLPREDWASLSADIRRRFAVHQAPIVYRGVLSVRRSWLGALFAWAATPLGRPLLNRNGEDIETEVHVYPDGHGGVVWERWMLEAGRPANCVRSTKSLGRRGTLEERTDRGLGMNLDVLVAKGALVFQSRGYFLQFGRFRLPLPAWATPGTCRVTHTSFSPHVFRFTLEMCHPLLGITFQQRGIFIDPVPPSAPGQVSRLANVERS
jgi:hypothetical protein